MTGAFQGLFALMNRSLQTEDRCIRTHIARLIFVALSYAMLVFTQSNAMFMSAPGLSVFRSMCYLNFFCITIAGISFFAAAITEEKEEMTLGLLKMAGVNSLSLLIGKSAPRLVAALVLLTAQLPFTMLAITLGGVSLDQVLAAYACLFAYLVFVANLALFFSVVCDRSRTAGLLTGTVLFLYFLGPFFANIARQSFIYNGWWTDGTWLDDQWMTFQAKINQSSAYARVSEILTTGFSESAISYQVITNFLMGLSLLLLGWLLFERCTRNEKPASEARGLLVRRMGAGRGVIGAGRPWSWALTWKDFHFVGGGKIMMLLKTAVYFGLMGLVVWTDQRYGGKMRRDDFGNIALSLGLSALVIEMAVQASRVFYTEVKWKTLSSVVLLPKTVGEIAYSKLLGAAISLVPALLITLLGIVCAPADFFDALGDLVTEPGAWYAITQVVLFIHIAALFSLYVKWGALPLAFATIYGGNMLLIFFVSILFSFRGPDDAFFGFMAFMSTLAAIAIHPIIGLRLKQLAAS